MNDIEKRYQELREELAETARNLSRVWERLDGDYGSKNYPFKKSFDDMALSIAEWSETDPKRS